MNIISCMFSKKYDEDLGVWNNFPPPMHEFLTEDTSVDKETLQELIKRVQDCELPDKEETLELFNTMLEKFDWENDTLLYFTWDLDSDKRVHFPKRR